MIFDAPASVSTDVCCGQGWGVVDAVTGHRHDASLLAEVVHDLVLAVRQDLGFDLCDPEAAGDGLGGDPVVAGAHDHVDSFPVGRAHAWE
jgi:hypothetical protein